MSNLCQWNPDRAEKLKGKGARFSWEGALQALLSSFDVKAFRKFTTTSARGGRNNKDSPPLVP